MQDIKLTDGKVYEAVHVFGGDRAIILFEGLYVLVDRVQGTDTWELSGEPARENEKGILNGLVKTIETTVTVTPPDDDKG